MEVAEEKSKVYITGSKLIINGLERSHIYTKQTLLMATLAASPRRALSPEEKKARDAQFKVEVKQFGKILKNLAQVFNALVALNTALGQAGKGAYLAFPNPQQQGTFVPFNRKHLRSANAQFSKAILALKNYLRVSKKKTREAVLPESFSGTYTPVYAGEALRDFFNAAPGNFGPLGPKQAAATQQAGQALMDSLQMVRQGYLLRNTSTMLFYIYAHTNTLQDVNNAQYARSDDVMMHAFGGQIAAAFYSYRGVDGKIAKLSMAQAVAQGIIPNAMNTYQVIAAIYPPGTRNQKGEDVGFRPDRFNTYYYQNIAAANYYSKAALTADPALADAATALARADVRQAMLNEHNIVKNVSAEWHDLLEPGRKITRDARKKAQDAAKKAQKAAGLVQQ
ncbi:Hypothetical protein HVR_LOCUS1340 [uncultured virus]|nr:Hypothetical protein HVR_LOCUS1340 [uncultured virus]